jgi:hypothetical protein
MLCVSPVESASYHQRQSESVEENRCCDPSNRPPTRTPPQIAMPNQNRVQDDSMIPARERESVDPVVDVEVENRPALEMKELQRLRCDVGLSGRGCRYAPTGDGTGTGLTQVRLRSWVPAVAANFCRPPMSRFTSWLAVGGEARALGNPLIDSHRGPTTPSHIPEP